MDAASLLEQAPIAARAVATRLRLPWLVRRSSLPAMLHALTPDRVDAAPVHVVERALSISQRIVERLRLVPNTCLYRALARYSMLRRAGHPARFVMALDRGSADIVGHAWVELDGKAFGEEIEPRLVVTFAYP